MKFQKGDKVLVLHAYSLDPFYDGKIEAFSADGRFVKVSGYGSPDWIKVEHLRPLEGFTVSTADSITVKTSKASDFGVIILGIGLVINGVSDIMSWANQVSLKHRVEALEAKDGPKPGSGQATSQAQPERAP